MNYRISVTTIESFRRYLENKTSYDTEKKLIQKLKGQFKGNIKTKIGSAFHNIIDTPYASIQEVGHGKKEWVKSNEFLFPVEAANKAIQYRLKHPSMVHEFPVTKVYSFGKYNIQISGKIDGIEGIEAHDAKLKFSQVEVEEYMESVQWKFYLDMIEGKSFRYSFFELSRLKKKLVKCDHGILLAGITIEDSEPLKLYAYESMQQELYSLLNEFMLYIEFRNLFQYLKPQKN